jgi:hypothetical protein
VSLTPAVLDPATGPEGPGGKEAGVGNDPAYHSSNPEDPQVYHDDNDCPEGKKIKPEHWAPGAAWKCKVCK